MSNYTERLIKTVLTEDGQIIDQVKYRKTSKTKGGWNRMYKKSYLKTQEECVKSLTDLKIWNFCIDNTRADFSVNINFTKIGKEMGVSRQKVHQFIKKSLEAGFLKKNSNFEYEMNPFIFTPFGCTEDSISSKQKEWKLSSSNDS